MTAAFALLILIGAALYMMTAEERARAGHIVRARVLHVVRSATAGAPPGEPFHDLLRARTRWPLVTPTLVALNGLVFTVMLGDARPLSDPQTLVSWGGNVAFQTANGEWWRLIAALFVHSGMLHLAVTITALLPLGLVLERAVGSVAFATVYLATGTVAGVVNLWAASAVSVGVGASGAIHGVYGLLLASLVWAVVERAWVPIPSVTMKRMGVAAAIFLLYSVVTDHLSATADLAGLVSGFVGGLLVARGVTRGKPPISRAVCLAATTALFAGLCTLPLRGITDIRPQVAQVLAFEERTAAGYGAAVTQFRKGRITAEALARVIDTSILPELEAIRARVQQMQGEPREHAPLVEAAHDYLAMREHTWRQRAAALRSADMGMLREADSTERVALDAFRRMSVLLR